MAESSEKERSETEEAPRSESLEGDVVEVVTEAASDGSFSFRLPVPGETYAVDGGDEATSIDLAGYESNDLVFGDGTLIVDMGAGQTFSIEYQNVDRIKLGDLTARVISGDHSQSDFVGSELVIDGDAAFIVSLDGPGWMEWTYERDKRALSIVETRNTKGNTRISVRSLGEKSVTLDSVNIYKRVGSLVSDVDIGTLTFFENGRADTVSVADGSGTIDTLHVTEGSFNHDVTVRGNVARLGVHDSIDRRADIHITGDVGIISIRGQVHPKARLVVDGNLGSLRVMEFKGRLAVAGDLGNVESCSGIEGRITARGVVGSFSLDDGAGTAIVQEFKVPAIVTVHDGKYTAECVSTGTDSEVDAGFQFGTPVPGETYVIRGGEGSDYIDLTGFRSSAASFENGSLSMELGGGQSFSIEYIDVREVRFADVTARVLTGNHAEESYHGSDAFIYRDKAFVVSLEGRGSIGWNYHGRKNTLSITNTGRTNADTTISVKDLAGADLILESITVNGLVGSLISDVDLGTLIFKENGRVESVSIRNGSGAIDTLRVTRQQFDRDCTVRGSVTFLEFDDDIASSARVRITGNASTLTVGGEVQDGATFTIDGSLGSVTAEEFHGALSIGGNLNAVESEDGIGGEITARGVIGSFTLMDGEGTTISHEFTEATTITWNNGNYSTEASDLACAGPRTHSAVATILAKPSQTVHEGDLVTLGLPSSDSNRSSYAWTQTGGTSVPLTGGNSARPSFTAPDVLFDEDLVFQVVMDDGTERTVDAVTVRVLARDDNAPVYDRSTQPVEEIEVDSLEAPTFDSEGDEVDEDTDYGEEAEQDTDSEDKTADLSRADSPMTNEGDPCESEVEENETGESDVEEVTPEPNLGLDAGPDQAVAEGDLVTLSVVSTELDGEVLAYSWTQVRGTSVSFASSGDGASFTAPKLLADEDLEFRATATDGDLSATGTVTVHVQTSEDVAEVKAGTARTVSAGEEVTITHGVTSSDSDALTSNWTQTSGPEVRLGSGASTSFVAPSLERDEDLVFQITVSDGGSILTETLTIRVLGDTAPFDVIVPDRAEAKVGASVVLSAEGSGPDYAVFQYAWRQVAGTPVVLRGDTTARPSFVVPPGSPGEDLLFQVDVTAGGQKSTRSVLVKVLDGPAGNTPVGKPARRRKAASGKAAPGKAAPGKAAPGKGPAGKAGPGPQAPGTKKPGAKKPGAKKPGAKKPGTKKPGAKKPPRKTVRKAATDGKASARPAEGPEAQKPGSKARANFWKGLFGASGSDPAAKKKRPGPSGSGKQ